jgi:nitrogen-specific signal transduction histidine kinase/CheY-like chemotaxis protein
VLTGKGEKPVTVSWSAAPFFQGAKIVGAVISMEDITEFKIMEDELIRVQKLESLGVLAGGIAHDFNNLLTAIMGNIEMARRHLRPDDKPYTRLAEAERAAVRARDLAQQLLTFSRGGAPVRQTVVMGQVINDAAALAVRGANISCTCDLPADLWPVHGDEGQLAQVMSNLIINACQAMPNGGIIRISGENMTVDSTGDRALRPGRYVVISLSDTGSGIPAEHLPRIFDPYFTSRKTGSGLGLATVHSIIKRHGGAVRVESEVGKGTTFRIYLPASSGVVFTPDTSGCLTVPGRGRVLVMDDENIIRDVAGEMLRELGYDVATAANGEETISLYSAAMEEGTPFNAVILDLTVQNGMGGKQTMERLLKIDPAARGVVSSGYSNDPVMADYRSYGFRAVVSKPYKVDDLCRTVQKVIANGG